MNKFCLVFAVTAITSMSAAVTSTCPALAADDDLAPGGVVDGTDVNAFFNSGPKIDPEAMEDASVPADKAVTLDPEFAGQSRPPKAPEGSRSDDYWAQPRDKKAIAAKTNGSTQASTATASGATSQQSNSTQANSQSGNQNTKPYKKDGPLKWYFKSWGRFFRSTGNLMGFPVGNDDDGTGNLKPVY